MGEDKSSKKSEAVHADKHQSIEIEKKQTDKKPEAIKKTNKKSSLENQVPDTMKSTILVVKEDDLDNISLKESVHEPSKNVNIHSKVKKNKRLSTLKNRVKNKYTQSRWQRALLFGFGLIALIALGSSALLAHYYKDKTLPNVYVAGVNSGSKQADQLNSQLQERVKKLNVVFETKEKQLKPSQKEIGYHIDTKQTTENAMAAKRRQGIIKKLAFWQHFNVPAVVKVNDTLLQQYVEAGAPELIKAPTDATLTFSPEQAKFIVTNQADGEGANIDQLKKSIYETSSDLKSKNIKITISKKGPKITEAKLQPMLEPANDLISRNIVLTGLGRSYRASNSQIAEWITPTPQENGEIKLIIDPAKVQSYVDGIGKKVASPAVDKKVLKDNNSGNEVVFQEGRDGTELSDKPKLASAIAEALKQRQDITQEMNIKVAPFQTINMSTYDKWLEIDISSQKVTAYEKATPVRSFTVTTGLPGHDTVTGEFAIWHKNRKQTMQGGSRADGSYYNIPNVEWVSYFYQDYAFHGAWWRRQFGVRGSHGCVNMTNADAQWVFEWAPMGTKVFSHN